MKLWVELPKPTVSPLSDGIGCVVSYGGEHRAVFTIGNVSVAFDEELGHINGCPGSISFTEYADDPVHINGTSVRDVSDPAEKLLYALAADLGYTLRKGVEP
jgi:hypothetical protein